MKILFFFVHPAKFHVFRHTIDRLMEEGHHVDVAIISKDVLPQLVEKTNWNCVNIFPEGRRGKTNSRIRIFSSALINFFKTVYRLHKYVSSRKIKYDLFVTDDCLSVVGKMLGVPVLFFLDNDVAMVKECYPLFWCSNKIFAPQSTDLGPFKNKKVSFNGCKELCYLHPDYFSPDITIPQKYNLLPKQYVLIRTVTLSATHDAGKKGISDSNLEELIKVIKKNGYQPVISSERSLCSKYEEYRFTGSAEEFIHILAGAAMCFGDSQTVNSEAIILGVPAICVNDVWNVIGVVKEQREIWELAYCYLTKDYTLAIEKANELLSQQAAREKWTEKYKRVIGQLDDVNHLLFETIKNSGAV